MNKLEEQLRASRRTEVPGLKPPAGGWEAISGKLAAGAGASAAGTGGEAANAVGTSGSGSAVAGTTAKTILLKWLAGLSSLLLVSSLTVYLITTEAESELVAEPTTELVEAEEGGQEEPIQYEVKEAPSMELTAAGSPDLQDAPPALVEEEPTPVTAAQLPPTQQAKVTTTESSAKSVARSQQSSSTDIANTVVGRTTALGETDEPPPPPSVPVTEERIAVNTEPRPEATSPSTFSEADEQQVETKPAPATSTADFDEPSTPPTAPPEPAELPSTPLPQNDTERSSDLPVSPSVATTPKAEPATFNAVNRLSSAPLAVSSYSGLLRRNLLQALPEPMVKFNKYRRNGKQRARAEWQLSVSYGQFSYGATQSRIYERDPTELSPNIFQLPGGETIHANFLSGSNSRTIRNFNRLAVGIDRQTSSGFLFHSSIGLYYFYTDQNLDEIADLSSDQIFVSEHQEEFAIPVEIGLHYTFLKRHRVRPYLGINLLNNLLYTRQFQSIFAENMTNQTGFVSDRSITRYPSLNLGISATLGVQYKLTNKWSAGGFLWLGGDENTLLETPYGIELRYTLK